VSRGAKYYTEQSVTLRRDVMGVISRISCCLVKSVDMVRKSCLKGEGMSQPSESE